MFEDLFVKTMQQWLAPLVPGQRVFVPYLATSLLLAALAFWQVERAHREEDRERGGRDGTGRVRPSFWAYVFDPEVWLHPSSRQDYVYFFVNGLVYYGLIAQFLLGVHWLSDGMHGALTAVFGTPDAPLLSPGVGLALYTLASVMAIDIALYASHRIFHAVPWLWEFHKVHHSAEQLNPITLFRMHPVDLFLTGLMVSVLSALCFGGFFFLIGAEPSAHMLFGLNVVTFLFYVFGYNLRHSHIWLDFPGWLGRVVISPAQHQIHHSSDPKHFNKNYGLIFAFWDRMGGTHYQPREREELSFGLSREEPNPFRSVWALYRDPFAGSARILRRRWSKRTPRERGLAAGLATATACALLLIAATPRAPGVDPIETAAASAPIPPAPPRTVEMEALTWTEVEAALGAGHTTVLIPTGGTEQNGPHVALGKHNAVVARTSRLIAERVGHTLVAPVMAYVPEGPIARRGHMAHPGTLTVPEAAFERVLESTVRSLALHGFRTVAILGDSGDSQRAQARVAERLQAEMRRRGVRLVHLDRYYSANGQWDALLAEGFTEAQIGRHAGLRDGSETLAVRPDWVRRDAPVPPGGRATGQSGALDLATPAMGGRMLELKIEAGAAQLREALAVPVGPGS